MTPKTLRATPLALCLAAAGVSAQTTDDKIDQLEQRLNALQQQLTQSQSDRVRLNGFFSTGFARASNNAGFAGITDKAEVKDLSLFALQGSFQVNDKTQAVMQIIGRGEEDWDPALEWAYISHRPTNNLQVRAGKMRLPFFMYSDSLEVGYSQPWVRPSEAVYEPADITSYVGADVAHTLNFDSSSLTTTVFGGFTDEDTLTAGQPVDVRLRNAGGLTLLWTDYIWSLRAVAATAETTIEGQGFFIADSDRSNFYGLGFGYDDGNWQVLSEVTRVEVDGIFADTDSAYLSVGHRFGSVTPYAKVGWIESVDNDDRPLAVDPTLAALNTRRDEYSLGLRWDVIPGIAIKADVTHARGFDGKPGGLGNPMTTESSTNVYTVKIDSAF